MRTKEQAAVIAAEMLRDQLAREPGDQTMEETKPVEVPTDPILQYFTYAHLPEHLREVSAPFGDLANLIVSTLPRNPERTVALRKLLEAKDCAVRAKLTK